MHTYLGEKSLGARYIVIHDYDGIDWRLIHEIVVTKLPSMCLSIDQLMDTLPSTENNK